MYNDMIAINQAIQQRFQLAKQGHTFNFETEIKPFVAKVDALVSSFKHQFHIVTSYPYFNSHKFNRFIQLIEEVSVECHYKNTSIKVFNDKIKVITHDLNYLKQMSEQKNV
ncbi:DUF1798 family protein [Staphylococcus hyicus]|uniref:DUF1798 family protein n=1 Tax=Staphylococcus hyicus TaxID=1284 RepID=UPI00217CF910|nr:DUF1798 family protein [Staphylococcus hyicus]UWF55768.1 DUF1798 family protein [Staphylococcus hyicus]